MNLRKLRWILIGYVLIDFLLGYAGIIPIQNAAAAQFTTVTGTVTDPTGIPYANGTISAILVTSASPTLNGFAYTPPTQPTGLNSAGSFTMQLADNTQLLPAATKWNFFVCSGSGTVQPVAGQGPICFTLAAPITISGASQNISANLNAVAPALLLTPTTIPNLTITSLHVGAGSLGAPSLSIGELVTGFYSPGTHQIGMVSNGFVAGNINFGDGFDLNSATFLGFCSSGGTCTIGDAGVNRIGAGILGVGKGVSQPNNASIRTAAYVSTGTTFTSSGGCAETSLSGGSSAGQFASGTTGTCATTITIGSTTNAPAHWACQVTDQTTHVLGSVTASTISTVSITVATTSGDTVVFGPCQGY